MSDKVLTQAEAATLWQELTSKYGAELDAVQRMIHTDATVFGYITPATEAKRQVLMKKILDENQVKGMSTPPPLAVIDAETNVVPGNFGKKSDAT